MTNSTMMKDGKVATLITEKNIEEYRRDARRIGVYGDGIEVGNYIYADRCGFDSFFVTFKPEYPPIVLDVSGSMSNQYCSFR